MNLIQPPSSELLQIFTWIRYVTLWSWFFTFWPWSHVT